MLVQVKVRNLWSGDLPLQVVDGYKPIVLEGFKSIGYGSLHRSTMDCSLAFPVTGVAGLSVNAT